MQRMDALYNLQKYDDTLADLRTKLAALAAEDVAMVRELKQLQRTEEMIRGEIQRAEAEAGQQEAEAGARVAEINRMNSRYLQVKTEKELEKYNTELQRLEADRDGLETAALAAMERAEEAGGRLQAAEKIRQGRETEFAVIRDRIGRETSNLQEEVAKLTPLRADFRAQMDEEALAQYDRIAGKRKPAVARVERQTCQGCHLQVPATILSDLRDRERPKTCPNCSRILYEPLR